VEDRSVQGKTVSGRWVEEDVTFAECPNYFRLEDRWVLIVSPFGPVRYAIGEMGDSPDPFAAERLGIVDHSAEYYATNTFLADGRVTPDAMSWTRSHSGCLSTDRSLRRSSTADASASHALLRTCCMQIDSSSSRTMAQNSSTFSTGR
jgi:hypothetical protein